MAFGKKKDANSPFAADYNREYDTHTMGPDPSKPDVSNPPHYADSGPDNFAGLGADRKYRNPVTSVNQDDLDYLGDTIGPREIQTGNAPSGGYSTLPGNGYAQRLDGITLPDDRRSGAYRPSDWEANQEAIHAKRDADTRFRRAETTVEDLANIHPTPYKPEIHAVEHSPIERRYSEGDRMTSGINPNWWRFWRDWDRAGDYRGSGARYLNGQHYSMAQHNSLDPYGPQTNGSAPVRSYRNTYRIDPQPWDDGITDSPNTVAGYDTVINRASVPQAGGFGQTYRLS